MRPTRREVLASAFALPFSFCLSEPQIIHDRTLLAEESAKGFRILLRDASVPLIILPAVRTISLSLALRLRRRALAGSWIVIESGLCFEAATNWKELSRVLRTVDVQIAAPLQVPSPYVSFTWPQRRMVRTFEAVTPVFCVPTESIATFDGLTVGARHSLGRGGVIFLGSMLGPALAAEEREAHTVCSQIFRKIFRRYIQNSMSQ